MTTLIMDWAEAADAGPAHSGRKRWQLGLLADFGSPVPPGFVINALA